MALLVSCTHKSPESDPYFAVTDVGGKRRDGSSWHAPVDIAISEIEAGTQTYYVNVNGLTPNLVIASKGGRKYLKAPFDPDIPATLLGLPSC